MLLRIAIVDDLPQDAERLQQALTAEGQTNIIRYESGDALLSAISPEQLDALFLDICMEGTNGIDTARKLREQAPTLPIVFVTSSKEYVWQSFPVHPFDDPYVIAGQGTIGMEILRQYQPSDGTRPDAIFVQIGGGGLAAGVATYIKAIYPEIKVFGVETVDSDAMKRSFDAGENVALDDVGLFSDGTAVKRVGDETLRLCRENLDGIVLVDSDEICAAIKDVFEDTRSIVEPSGALSLAGLKAWARKEGVTNKTLVAITSGANMNFDRLRFVCERAEFGEDREAVFAVTIPEERGSFRRLCGLLGNRAVTEFNYRMSDNTDAYIFVGVQTTNANDVEEIEKALKTEGFPALNLSHDELAKLHLRHMVGGHSKLAVNEKLYRFEFPERPGALMKFLTSLAPQWNISLFHYRNNGADFGRVFAGIQVPPQDNELFEQFLKTLGYRYWDETDNPACRFFLS